MKPYSIATTLCALALSAATALAADIPGLFSTGVDNSGNPLAAGSIDPHYTLTTSPAGPTVARATAPYFMWLGNTGTSSWINDNGNSNDSAAGYYTYSITFSLTGFDPSTASISGLWATDNTATISLNGNPTGISHSTPWEFVNFDSFTINSGFVAGNNTLSFIVHNAPSDGLNPSGLQVQITSATVVPEPATVALLGLAAGFLGRRRR